MAKKLNLRTSSKIPPPPEGFVLDKPQDVPPPPEGFVLDKPSVEAPEGFVLDKQQGEPDFSPEQIERIGFLQKKLRGRLPSSATLQELSVRDRPIAPGVPTMEMSRRKASAELERMGFSLEQQASALAFEEGIKPPSKAPQTAGALAATLVLGRLIPGPLDDAAILAGMLKGRAAATAAGLAGKARLARGITQATVAGLGGTIGKSLQVIADPDAEFNAGELAKVFGEEYIYEGATLGLAPIGKKIIGGAKSTLIPGAERLSQKLARAGQRAGVKLKRNLFTKTPLRFLPAQFSENQLVDTVQGIGENSLIGSDTIFQFKRGQVKAAEFLLEGLSEEIVEGASKSSVDDVASLVFDTIEDRGISHSVAARSLYKAVDDVTKQATVNVQPIKQLAREILKKADKAGRIGHTPASLGILDTIINDVDDVVSFETAQDVRSGLLDILRKGESKLTPDPKSVGIVKRITPQIDKAMAVAARNTSPQAEQMWRKANDFWKQGKSTFQNKMIRKLMRTLPDNPEVVSKSIFRPNATKSILRVKRAAGPKAFQEIKGAWIEQLVRESATIDPSAVAGVGEVAGSKMLRKFNGLGPTALDAAFTKTEQQAVRDATRILGIVQAKTGGHSGALRFVQGSALAGIVASPFVPNETASRSIGITSGVILLGPAVLGRLMTKPTFAKLLSEGLKTPAGTQQSIALTARLVRNVMQARKEINEERLRREKERTSFDLIKQAPSLKELRGFKGRGF